MGLNKYKFKLQINSISYVPLMEKLAKIMQELAHTRTQRQMRDLMISMIS